MKIAISYPPLESEKGIPLLSQNRQFQWFSNPTYIYPVVPAQAATMLKANGFDVMWDDGIVEELTYNDWENRLFKNKPDIIVFETKTPVIKMHWEIINNLKNKTSSSGYKPFFILVGDHATTMPEESFENSMVDFILTGGDYDFLLLNLCKNLEYFKNNEIDNFISNLEFGVYFRKDNEIINTGKFILNHDLNSIPFIDRDLTKWKLYSVKNGNFLKTPGTYIMSGRDCWHGKCTFCSWTTLYPEYRVRDYENVLDEIGLLIDKYKVKEIMDDTGTFPIGNWLRNFCTGMIKRGYNKKVILDCNMRFDGCNFDDYKLMGKAGFRFILFGLESASNYTLDRINKKIKTDQIIESCKNAKKAGLSPHITIMFGYPWEKKEDILNTLKLGSYLLRKNYAKTMQATIVIPYPGTPLFYECLENDLLTTQDWERFDMKESIMKSEVDKEFIKGAVQNMYKNAFNFEFIFRKIIGIKNIDDIKFLFKATRFVFGHVADFKKNKT
ncbi:MAG: B12-binding domain-containing radical SAM protein [Candidatus Humimicrobiaceae bacterium]